MTASADWSVWSTTARVVVTDPAALDHARSITARVLAHVDAAASRFRADSEVCTLARDADGAVPVSPLLATLVRLSLDAAERTAGAVDPTVGATLADLGYDRDIEQVRATGSPMTSVRPVAGWRTLHLRGDRLWMPLGLHLDFGAVAKAWAADLAAELAAQRCGTGVLVSLGGDLATAGPEPDGGWQVTVQDAADQPASHLALHGTTAVATSSTLHRTWRRGEGGPSGEEQTAHHIVDPVTGRPAARTWRTVTVVAPSCVEANTLSTAAVVKGRAALAWLERQGRPARLVAADGTVHRLGGYPAESDAPRGAAA